MACRRGHLKVAREILASKKIPKNVADKGFLSACVGNHAKVARQLFQWSKVTDEIKMKDAFKAACGHGNSSLAQWIAEQSNLPTSAL